MRFFYFETVFITIFERGRYLGLQCYKWKLSSRDVSYTGDFKEKVKSLENYLRGGLFLRKANPNIQGRQTMISWGR